MQRSRTHAAAASTADEIAAFTAASRDLVGVALRSIAPEDLTVPQFRLLLVLHEKGTASSSNVARALGLAPSSVTRMADRLVEAGQVARGASPEHRGVVTLSLTTAGNAVVDRVLERRRTELAAVLDCLSPELRAACAEGLRAVHDLLGGDSSIAPVLL